MSPGDLADAVGWIALLLGVASTFAQFDRGRRQGVDGVSLATWSLFVMLGCFWISYGVASGSAIVALGSLLPLPMQLFIVARLEPAKSLGVVGRSFAVAFGLCGATTWLFGWSGGLLGAGIAMILLRGPQFVELVRSRSALGVSVASWSVSATCLACWAAYYFVRAQWVACAVTAVATLASGAIALLASWRHRRAGFALARAVARA